MKRTWLGGVGEQTGVEQRRGSCGCNFAYDPLLSRERTVLNRGHMVLGGAGVHARQRCALRRRSSVAQRTRSRLTECHYPIVITVCRAQ